MSQNEQKLLDKTGKFLQVVKNGTQLEDVGWISGRIILSNRRLVLAGNQGARKIPLAEIDELGGRYDVNQAIARVSQYTSVRFGEQVILLTSSADPEEIEHELYAALLDHERILARHPAVEGGVIQDTEWHPAQLKTERDAVNIALTDGTFVEVELDDISTLNTAEQLVEDENRRVLKVEHTSEDTSVQTYLSGTDRHMSVLEQMLREGDERSEFGEDLSYREEQVLMALHSGVSPFEIPDFVGMEVEEVEEIYERLIEVEALSEIRQRTEVELTARGRKIAGGAMDDE